MIVLNVIVNMQKINPTLNIPSQSTPTKCTECDTKCKNPRGCLIQQFVNAINRDRIGTNYGDVKWQRINGMLNMMKEGELYMFYEECLRADIFSKRFYGGFKEQKWQINK